MGGHSKIAKGRRSRAGLAALLAAFSLLSGALPERKAQAFCGFYVGGADKKLFNNATLVVLLREGTRTVLSMQNNYQGPPESFAMVVPVPVVLQKENVKTLPREVFDHIDQLSAPRLVEYWEQNPCTPDVVYDAPGAPPMASAAAPSAAKGGRADYGVKIEAQFTIGEYEIVILSARDSGGLDRWLTDNHYKIPEGAEPLLRPYVQQGSKFFVAKVDVSKVKMVEGRTMLSPLRFHYDSEKFNLPVRLGLANSAGTQDLVVHILARDQRYELANYKNVTIPTNIDIDEKAKDQFPAFYAALFDRTLEKNLDSDKRPPVVTEYAWGASNCDPCPGPPLAPGDMATLGTDTLEVGDAPSPTAAPGTPRPAPPPISPRGNCGCAAGDLMCAMKCSSSQKPGPAATGAAFGGSRGRWGNPYSSYVVTRLHARYTRDQLAEDLVFKEATPITGGREVFAQNGRLENGAVAAGFNNFQGRYAIRHPWTGPIDCPNPRRGVWGGPPPGQSGGGGPEAARDLAFAPRGGVDLASLVKGDVPEIGVVAKFPAAIFPPSLPRPSATTGLLPSPTSSSSAGASSGCGCRVAGSGSEDWGSGALAACIGAALAFCSRRRKEKRNRS